MTFLFTDIEGSTQLWESAPDAMRSALERHDTLLRGAIDTHEGYVFSTGGGGADPDGSVAAGLGSCPSALAWRTAFTREKPSTSFDFRNAANAVSVRD